jgi:hypothetical protein
VRTTRQYGFPSEGSFAVLVIVAIIAIAVRSVN